MLLEPRRDASFEVLLQGLSDVHEHQQEAIRKLREENACLHGRLEELGGGDGSSHEDSSEHKMRCTGDVRPTDIGEPKIECIANVKPPEIGEGELECLANLKLPDMRQSKIECTANVKPPEPIDIDAADDVCNLAAFELPRRGSRCSSHMGTESMTSFSVSASMAWPVPPMWQEWVRPPGSPQRVLTRHATSSMLLIEDTTGQALTVVNRCYQRIIVRPNSVIRLIWDFLSCFMVLYDVISIPLMAINLVKSTDSIMDGGTGPFTDVMDWTTTVFWTVDIPWSFMTGYHADGVVEMRAYEIARHYIKTWFGFDFMLICIDWSIVYASIVAGRGAHMLGLFRIGKTARMARILRTVRLLRFVKLQRVLCECLELINSEYIRACFNVTLAVAFIFVINHYLACGWFLVGHICWTYDWPNWIAENKIQDTTVGYAYFTSLHWSLTQFTPASMEIRPYNLAERIYSILCLMFALITFSSFLGSITASISQLRRHTTDAGKQQFILRSYFTRNKVSSSLSKSIWNFLKQHHFNQMTRSHKAQIEVLKLLPPHLMGMLHQELYSPYITRAPFFYHYAAFSSEGLIELCSEGVTERTLICGEVLFTTGKVAENMFFAASGFLRYEHPSPLRMASIGTGAWISEPVLWLRWVHIAPLIADTSAEIIALDSAHFRRIIPMFKRSLPFVKVYAQLFHQHLLKEGPQHMSDIMDDVQSLESITREAWHAVTSSKERTMFQDMPNPQFPRVSIRQRQVKPISWRREPRRGLSGMIKRGMTRLRGS